MKGIYYKRSRCLPSSQKNVLWTPKRINEFHVTTIIFFEKVIISALSTHTHTSSHIHTSSCFDPHHIWFFYCVFFSKKWSIFTFLFLSLFFMRHESAKSMCLVICFTFCFAYVFYCTINAPERSVQNESMHCKNQ